MLFGPLTMRSVAIEDIPTNLGVMRSVEALSFEDMETHRILMETMVPALEFRDVPTVQIMDKFKGFVRARDRNSICVKFELGVGKKIPDTLTFATTQPFTLACMIRLFAGLTALDYHICGKNIIFSNSLEPHEKRAKESLGTPTP